MGLGQTDNERRKPTKRTVPLRGSSKRRVLSLQEVRILEPSLFQQALYIMSGCTSILTTASPRATFQRIMMLSQPARLMTRNPHHCDSLVWWMYAFFLMCTMCESGSAQSVTFYMSWGCDHKGFPSKLKYSLIFSIRMQIYYANNIQILLFSAADFSHFIFSSNALMFLPIGVALSHVRVYNLKP